MAKAPAFQFYPSDWTRDLDDQDLEIEGAWIRICCRLWWSDTPGRATKSLREWSYVLRTHPNKTGVLLKTLLRKGIATGEFLDNQNITIISRRMVRDNEISQIRRASGIKGGNPALTKTREVLDNQAVNQKPTPSSSSSTTDKQKKEIIKKEKSAPPPKQVYREVVLLADQEYANLCSRYGQLLTERAIEILNNAIQSKGYKYKSHYHTLLGWPIREAQEIDAKGASNGINRQKSGLRAVSSRESEAILTAERIAREWEEKQRAKSAGG